MILDRLENAKRYLPLSPHFAKAFEFLDKHNLRDLPLGRHEIDGDRVYATAMKGPGRLARGRAPGGPPQVHRCAGRGFGR